MSKRTNWIIITFMFFLAFSVVTSYAQDAENNTNDPNDPNSPTQEKIQEIKLRVDGNQIKSYIEWLARDDMKGRKSLTDGYKKAADWAAKNFKDWGLKPAGQNGTYFQEVPIERGFTYMTGIPELRIANQTFLMEEGDFSIHPKATAATRINADIVFVGYGISAPDKGLDEYADMEIEGKIVLVFTGSPKDAQPPRGRFAPTPAEDEASNEPWEKESTERAKIQTAYDNGAAAILLFNPGPEPERESDRRFTPDRRPGRDNEDEPELKFERDFLIFTIEPRVFHAIMKPDPQESLTGLNRRIESIRWDIRKKQPRSMATGIRARLKGYDNIEEYSEKLENNIARNVLAKIEGTDPNLKDQYIIMGGHMDHLGVRNGLVYNGADDNASGTAVVMEVARVLSQSDFKPKRTIIFCCWCGEELGLLGSIYYTDNPCDGVTMDKVVTYFNADMVGLGDKIGAPGALNFPKIWEIIKKNQDEDVISAVEPETGGPGGSDHSGFITKGIEALALMTSGGGGHPDYHRPEDDADKIDPEILRKTGQFVLQGTMNLANETKTNLLIENRLWIYEGMRLSVANINPNLEGSDWSCIDIEGYSQDKLRWRIASIEEKPEKRVEVGIPDLKIFEGDVELLIAASDALGFGRADVKCSDGEWIAKGQLTELGRYTLGMMEENRIVVNLVSPSPQLLRDVLANATRPFIVTGFYLLDPQTYEQINKKKVILGVKFDPADVDGCIERLEKGKAALGDTDNLVLYVTSTENLDDVKRDLYMRLMKNGWKSEEIGGAGGRRRRGRGPTGTGITGGNLGVLWSSR
ncbi:MAG: M20/M25/M40 family metallo-hydrolase [Sedimentisphaerales bacterium]|nr:M20/M25/M40 family metallo-hydrolase [Sedimentisphaerales bacterium]